MLGQEHEKEKSISQIWLISKSIFQRTWLVCYNKMVKFTHLERVIRGLAMEEEKLGQPSTALFKYAKLILSKEETTSAGGCGVSHAAFSCPVSVCCYDSTAQGIFYCLERGGLR